MANALRVAPPQEKKEKPSYPLTKVIVRDTKIRFTVYDKKTGKLTNTYYDFKKSDLPKYYNALQDSDDCVIGITPDKDEVIKMSPGEGIFKAKVKDFLHDEDADPAPIEKEDFFNPGQMQQVFTAVFEILKGSWKGAEVVHFLDYKFQADEDGNTMWIGDPTNPKAKRLPRLIEFCEKTGCVDSPIEWPEDGNILPELLARILRANKIVDIVIKKGKIESIMSSDYEEEQEAPKAKAKANGKGHKAEKVEEPEEVDEFADL